MAKRWIIGIAAVIVAISVGGIGYAAFTTSITASGSATAGTPQIEWSGTPSTSTSGGTVSCSAPVPAFPYTTLGITAGNLNLGDWCQVTENVYNNGNLNVVLTSSASITGTNGGMGCPSNQFSITDSFSSPVTLNVGTSTSDTITVTLLSNANAACAGVTASFSDTITGTATG